MGSGGAGLPRGGGRRGEEPVGLAGPCQPGTGPPVTPDSGLSGLAPWGGGGRDRGVSVIQNFILGETVSCQMVQAQLWPGWGLDGGSPRPFSSLIGETAFFSGSN